MHVLRALASEYGRIRQFASRVIANPGVHGVILDINPFWHRLYRLEQAGVSLSQGDLPPWVPGETVLGDVLDGDGPLDLYWRHEAVDAALYAAFQRKFDGPHSVMLRVLLRPASQDAPDLEINVRAASARQQLAESPIPAVVEVRPVARFLLSSGSTCTSPAGARGTVGGFLVDRSTGKTYAATCGHVVSSGLVRDASGAVIGRCAHAQGPAPGPGPGLCDPASAQMTRLDLALIDVHAHGGNRNVAVAGTIRPKDLIDLDAPGGLQRYEVGGTSLIQEVGGCCFENLFEVRPPAPTGIVSARVKGLFASVPSGGDSGSWVHRVAAAEWCGMLVGADHLMGYAFEAEDVLREGDRAFGTNLWPA